MSIIVTIRIKTRSTIKARETIFSSISLVNFFFLTLYSAIKNHRPPSSAGIGKTFIHANETEINAARKARFVGPAAVKAGNKTPIIPTGPETESLTSESASCRPAQSERCRCWYHQVWNDHISGTVMIRLFRFKTLT